MSSSAIYFKSHSIYGLRASVILDGCFCVLGCHVRGSHVTGFFCGVNDCGLPGLVLHVVVVKHYECEC